VARFAEHAELLPGDKPSALLRVMGLAANEKGL
jgi:hypothetical protein